MEEKAYKVMKAAGISSIVLGIIAAVSGVSIGVISVINGASLLKNKSKITF